MADSAKTLHIPSDELWTGQHSFCSLGPSSTSPTLIDLSRALDQWQPLLKGKTLSHPVKPSPLTPVCHRGGRAIHFFPAPKKLNSVEGNYKKGDRELP